MKYSCRQQLVVGLPRNVDTVKTIIANMLYPQGYTNKDDTHFKQPVHNGLSTHHANPKLNLELASFNPILSYQLFIHHRWYKTLKLVTGFSNLLTNGYQHQLR